MQRVFFTSDTHFGHEGSLRWRLEFRDVEQMNATLIDAWNEVVAPRDEVWHLGDFCWHEDDPDDYLSRLNGSVHLVGGNHDHLRALTRNGFGEYGDGYGDGALVIRNEHEFASVQQVKYLRRGGHKFWLSHYAHRHWPNSEIGCIHLFGHNHGDVGCVAFPDRPEERAYALPPVFGKTMDVGVDVTRAGMVRWAPLALEDVVGWLSAKPHVYRHPDMAGPRDD